MPRFGLVGPSYTDQSVNADAQMTMNLYPEVIESGAGNAPIILLPTPGLQSFATITPHPPITVTFNNYGTSTVGGWVPGQSNFTITVLPINSPGSGAILVGDVGFVMLVVNGADALFSLTDDKGNTWRQLGSTQNPIVSPLNPYYVYTFWARMGTQIPVSGSLTITATLGNTVGVTSITFPGFSNCTGLPSGSILSGPLQAMGTTANPVTGSIAISQPACLVSFMLVWPNGSPLLTLPTGWTDTQIANLLRAPVGWGGGYIVENSNGTFQDQWTSSAPNSPSQWAGTFAAFT